MSKIKNKIQKKRKKLKKELDYLRTLILKIQDLFQIQKDGCQNKKGKFLKKKIVQIFKKKVMLDSEEDLKPSDLSFIRQVPLYYS